MYPETLKYRETHEWVAVEGDIASVGITGHAVKELTDLTYLELPEVGASFEAGEPFGVIESVKATSDLYAPVSGEVIDVNNALVDDLDILKDDPYGRGWMLKLRATDLESELEMLLSAKEYEELVEQE